MKKRLKIPVPKRIALKTCILALFLCKFLASAGQNNLRFTHYNTSDGLLSNVTNCIIEDDIGFLWIGTGSGLCRFDGYSFKSYTHNQNDSTSISDDYITCIYKDTFNNIWVGTNDGLNKYDKLTQRFIRFKNNPNDSTTIISNGIRSITGDKNGNLWISTLEGLSFFDNKNNTFTNCHTDSVFSKNISSNDIKAILLDSNDKLWIGVNYVGLVCYDVKNNSFERYVYSENNPNTISGNRFNHIYESKDGKIWIGYYSKGMDYFDTTTGKFTNYYKDTRKNRFSSRSVKWIFEDSYGQLWIGTWAKGLYKYNNNSDTFTHYHNNPDDPNSIVDNRIKFIYEDQSGQIWFATQNGLDKMDPKQQVFKHYYHQTNNPYSLSNNYVNCILEASNGIVWVGTYDGGINRYDRETNKFYQYKGNPNNPNAPVANGIWCAHEDKKGRIWFGHTGGLLLYNPKENNFIRYEGGSDKKDKIYGYNILTIDEDQYGRLWLGSWNGGVDCFDPKTEKAFNLGYNELDTFGLSSLTIKSLKIFNDSLLLIGTGDKGLDIYNMKSGQWKNYQNVPNDTTSISSNQTVTIYVDLENSIWIGTFQGLNLFDIKNEKFERFGTLGKKKQPRIGGILKDEKNNLWLSTNDGLCKFNPAQDKYTWFDGKDGLQDNHFSLNSAFKGSKGRMYFGGGSGYNEFIPDSIKSNEKKPQVVISKFLLFDKEVKVNKNSPLTIDLNYTDNITLKYTDQIFSFEFSALNYRQPEKNKFAYLMEGVSNNWIYTDYKYRRATYTNLSPGNYVFRVKASNDDGIWNETGKNIHVRILPPWWRTIWARTIWISLIVGSLFGIYYIRVSFLKRQKRTLEIQVKERTNEINLQKKELSSLNKAKDKMFSIIGHDLRGPLGSLYTSLDMITDKQFDFSSQEKDKILKSLSEGTKSAFALVENLLNWSQSQRNTIPFAPDFIPLHQVIQTTFNLLQTTANNKNIKLESTISDDVVVYADKNMMKTIFRNLVSNAIKFSNEKGNIEISSNKKDKQVEIKVKDFGVGIPKENLKKILDPLEHVTTGGTKKEKGSGLGLTLCKELVERNNGAIRVESELGKGSTFIVTLHTEKYN